MHNAVPMVPLVSRRMLLLSVVTLGMVLKMEAPVHAAEARRALNSSAHPSHSGAPACAYTPA